MNQTEAALVEHLERMIEFVEPDIPEANCCCHVSPPCSDCVDHGGMRQLIEDCKTLIDRVKGQKAEIGWREIVLEHCMAIEANFDEKDPRKTLHGIISWHVKTDRLMRDDTDRIDRIEAAVKVTAECIGGEYRTHIYAALNGNTKPVEESKPAGWECAARKSSLPEPQECNWPLCGCDPYADKVVTAMVESNMLHPPRIPGSPAWFRLSSTGDWIMAIDELAGRGIVEETAFLSIDVRVPFWRVNKVRAAIEPWRTICVRVKVGRLSFADHFKIWDVKLIPLLKD